MFKRWKQLPSGVKASLAYVIASFVNKGIAYITTPFYTRLLTDEEFGYVSVFFTWLDILGIVAMFSLSAGVFNIGMADYPEKRGEYSFSILILSNLITVIFAMIIIPIYFVRGRLVDISLPYLLLMCIVFLFQPAYNFWMARQRYEYKYKATCFWTVFSSLVPSFVAVILLIGFNNHHIASRILGYYGVLVLIYVCFYIKIGKDSNWKLQTKYWKAAFLFNLPLIPHYLSAYILNSCDKLMISRIVGNSFTAYYSVSYSIAAVALAVWNSINASLVPFTYEKCKNKDYKSINQIVVPLLLIFAVGCVFVTLLAPEILKMLAPSSYYEAVYVIPSIVCGVFFQVQYSIYANIVYYYKKPKYVMYSSLAAALINIVLNYVFINKYGYIAAGYTTLICYLIQSVLDYIAMRKVTTERIYNMKHILIISLGSIACAMFSIMVYNYIIIRFMFLAFLLVMFYVFRKKILSTIKLINN